MESDEKYKWMIQCEHFSTKKESKNASMENSLHLYDEEYKSQKKHV